MAVVTGAIGSLISKLGQLLSDEYKQQKSAREKMESLIKELECAHATLRKVDGAPPDELDEQIRIWARELRDASYDMENIIDTFLVCVDSGHKENSAGQESFHKRLRGLTPRKLLERQISCTMDNINKRLEDITRRHGRYTVDNITVASPAAITSTVDPRLAAMYKEMSQLMGISKSSNDLMSMLEKRKMVSVVGVGGLGKTTLAKSVYDKHKVDFECSAFVPVGRDPDLKKVFRDILIDIDKNKYTDLKWTMLDERQLINVLRENLENKRYLLVIDDIWEKKSWEIIKLALVQKNSGSRVITTTRIVEVAKEAGEIYKLQKLQYEESKQLFYTRTFGADGTCPYNQMDQVSERILKKCDGVPLAIITISSLLVHKSREQWIEVCNSIFNRQANRDVSSTEWILSLSYYDLPAHLKTCLLYLSAFPEDFFIEKNSLIWKWVAEGFVQKKEGTGFYEVGEGYFNDLINRSIIQVSDWDHDTIEGCRVHDMVLDLLRHISQKENFMTFSNNDNTLLPSDRVYRLAYQKRTVKPIHHHHHLRSLIAYNCVFKGLSLQRFGLLRVLALQGCKGSEGSIRLKNLVSLLHLRYLRLRYSDTDELPEGIGALKLLQTLDVEDINHFPSSLGQLTQLICLRAWIVTMPSGVIEKLTSLETLEISIHKDMVGHFVKELGRLRELRLLKANLPVLEGILISDLVESLVNLSKIQKLKLRFRSLYHIDDALWGILVLSRTLQCLDLSDIHFPRLPSHINPLGLPKLSILRLSMEYMDDKDLEILGLLPELRLLNLSINHPKVLTINSANDGWFRKLRTLSLLESMVKFVPKEDLSVPFSIGHGQPDVALVTEARDFMPKLELLEFIVFVVTLMHEDCSCGNLGLECIPSLQKVKVEFSSFLGSSDDEEKEVAALRKAIADHPNRPSLELPMYNRNLMRGIRPANEVQEEEEEEEDVNDDLSL